MACDVPSRAERLGMRQISVGRKATGREACPTFDAVNVLPECEINPIASVGRPIERSTDAASSGSDD